MPETPTPVVSPAHPELTKAIAEAQLLLAFAAKNAISLPEETIATIVHAQAHIQAQAGQALPVEKEIAFWHHCNLLAAAVAPVSAESLQVMAKGTCEKTWWQFWRSRWWHEKSGAHKSVVCYTAVATITMLLLVTVQAYWAVGTMILADMKTTSFRFDTAIIEKAPAAAQQRVAPTLNEAPATSDAPAAQKKLWTRHDNPDSYRKAGYTWLVWWCSVPLTVLGMEELEAKGATVSESAALPDAAQNTPARKTFPKDITGYKQCAVITLEVLQRYILPMLYGLLGACVYVLRNLSAKIKKHTFIEASRINFRIRLCFGMLGGLAVVWFVTPENGLDPLISLSPLALAFLAGYSVDILFAAMDTLIAAFTSRSKDPRPQ